MFAERMERLRVRLVDADQLMPKSYKVPDTNILSVADVELDSVMSPLSEFAKDLEDVVC
jgi:hypothetical protein